MEKNAKSKGRKPSKRKFPKGSQRKGYHAESNAICIVVHDLGGMPVNDRIANEILDVVTEKAVQYGYVVNYTRQ